MFTARNPQYNMRKGGLSSRVGWGAAHSKQAHFSTVLGKQDITAYNHKIS